MKKGTPIIHSAPIYNDKNNTYGIIDLLVRSDYINKLFNNFKIDDYNIKAPNLDIDYHYRVIEIKYCSLYLSSNGVNFLNSNKIPAYKAQLCIYNVAIANIQGYKPPNTYILGIRYQYISNDQLYLGESSFDRPGVVD